MDGFEPMGRALVIIGIFITVLGAVMLLTPRILLSVVLNVIGRNR